MNQTKITSTIKEICLLSIIILFFNLPLFAQNNSEEIDTRYLYQPPVESNQDTATQTDQEYEMPVNNRDSIIARLKFMRDSIEARQAFIRDSILVREAFVRDSIMRRQRILDSLNLLKTQLPKLIDAGIFTNNEQFIVNRSGIEIVGDSALSDYSYIALAYTYNEAFTPWLSTIGLSDGSTKIGYDASGKHIKSIKAPNINWIFDDEPGKHLMKITGQSLIVSKSGKKFYRQPLDSIFYDGRNRIAKIKRYALVYAVNTNYQRGNYLFTYLKQVKQFEYTPNDQMSGYQVASFLERWTQGDPVKIINVVNYKLGKQGSNYAVTRRNDPANAFTDGTFTYEFVNGSLKSVSFKKDNSSEYTKTIIELNEKGYVSRYIYEENEDVPRTLLVNYYLDDPKAPYKAETITCTFEDDGISYFQKNNTTGKIRTRDRMTGEWSEWK